MPFALVEGLGVALYNSLSSLLNAPDISTWHSRMSPCRAWDIRLQYPLFLPAISVCNILSFYLQYQSEQYPLFYFTCNICLSNILSFIIPVISVCAISSLWFYLQYQSEQYRVFPPLKLIGGASVNQFSVSLLLKTLLRIFKGLYFSKKLNH